MKKKLIGVDNESEKIDEEGLWTEVNGRGIKYIPEEKREFYLGDGIEFLAFCSSLLFAMQILL